ncbi:MAG: hypothetical protein WCR54_06120 [Clostridia bacterium]
MLFSDNITILEVNSTTLRLVQLKKRESNFYPIYTKVEKYDGIVKGMLVKPDQLFSTIQNMIYNMQQSISISVKKIFIILPQIFFGGVVEDCDVAVSGNLVSQIDINLLCSKCRKVISGHTIIDCVPVKFKTINDPVLENPIGQSCERLYGQVATISLDTKIKEFYDNVAKNVNKKFVYVCENSAIAYLLDESLKLTSKLRCLVTVREEYSSVSLVSGKAILSSKNINWGALHIIRVIQDLLQVNEEVATKLSKKLNLNVICHEANQYVLNYKNNVYKFSMKEVNDRVIQTLEYIFGQIAKLSAEYFKEENNNIPIYLTGHDICQIKGVAEILSASMDSTMAITINPNLLEFNTQSDYPLVGVIEKESQRLTQNSLQGKMSIFFRRIKNGY